jgi:hypothetical protein
MSDLVREAEAHLSMAWEALLKAQNEAPEGSPAEKYLDKARGRTFDALSIVRDDVKQVIPRGA